MEAAAREVADEGWRWVKPLSTRRYEPEEVARGGAFVTLDSYGALRIERGFVRPEDEPRTDPAEASAGGYDGMSEEHAGIVDIRDPTDDEDAGEPDGPTPLTDRLVAELTAHRTAARREAVAADPDTALVAVTHALALAAFYPAGYDPAPAWRSSPRARRCAATRPASTTRRRRAPWRCGTTSGRRRARRPGRPLGLRGRA